MASSTFGLQTTLRQSITLSGIGVHCAKPATLTLNPSPANSGITFRRLCGEGLEFEIPADFRNVNATEYCTAVGAGAGSVATIEHLMATFSALSIDNVAVEIDGGEVPVMDGSAEPFIEAIDKVGVKTLAAPRRFLRIKKAVRVDVGTSFAEFRPHKGSRIEVEIDFKTPLIGRQSYAAEIDGESFRRDLARARTFGFMAEVEQLWARGFALGASLDNAVVLADDRIVNPEGLRFADEFVRHKALDAIGDIALAGAPIIGCFHSFRGGHKVNHKALEALFADAGAFEMVELAVRRDVPAHAELGAGLAAAAFGPDVS
jgi:UDP-3-O-[3-hydroxymyristoyl] N-acetylglucosamine deacetylase